MISSSYILHTGCSDGFCKVLIHECIDDALSLSASRIGIWGRSLDLLEEQTLYIVLPAYLLALLELVF
jgi:hypothetical protein